MSDLEQIKDRQRKMWTIGDFPTIAGRIESASAAAVEVLGVEAGDRVLDVATGTGNAALIAAAQGAEVSGIDLAPKLIGVAAERAAEAGVEIDLLVGDAENLPYEDASFDKVTSVFGVMFAPHQQRGADELVRVCRPGGKIAVCAWTPEGANGQMFAIVGRALPPPPEGFQPPVLWGVEDHVRGLFADVGGTVSFERRHVRIEEESMEAWLDRDEELLGPVVLAKESVGPEGWGEVRGELAELFSSVNLANDGSVVVEAEYLLSTIELD